ncbi:unnamed protein product [Lactuca virosa]|uniref:Chlorophyll a-b binding protein, chloroplastic n=1 Tax=Lactuca virosa TaxID=75947 RepID=A0AAU9LWX8_9ASTR|nr:unnamed protein product [Lactuca virosa]
MPRDYDDNDHRLGGVTPTSIFMRPFSTCTAISLLQRQITDSQPRSRCRFTTYFRRESFVVGSRSVGDSSPWDLRLRVVVGGIARWTGAVLLNGNTLNYFGKNIPINLVLAIVAEVVLVGGAEYYTITNGMDFEVKLYPGGPFDPLGLANDPN